MICPYCNHDNIAGDDVCAECGQSLVGLGDGGTDLVETISRHNVNVLNPRPPVTLPAATTLEKAVDAMLENRIGCVLITSDSTLLGIVTERDVLNKAADDPENLQRPIVEFMTPAPETILGQDSIAYALHAMDLGGYRHLPILDAAGRPTGIISIRDILRFLCVRFADGRSR
jgi:CBS domain-containing protein